jgi:integrase
MALWKRGGKYWTDFSIDGERFRLPLGTSDEREAKRHEKDKIKQAMEGRIRSKVVPLSKLLLKDAIEPYLADKKPHVATNTWVSEKERLNQVQKLMGEIVVRKITSDTVKQYVARRIQTGRSGKTINLEIGALRRLMKEAGVWQRIGDSIKLLPQRSDIGRALEKEEKIRLLDIAASSTHWAWAKLAAELALNTTMRSCEIRGLQWKHLDLLDNTLRIRRQTTKSDAGERNLPLNADALAAILELRQLSKELFGDDLQPTWYVFPSCEGFANPDPTRPMRGWRTAWRRLTEAVDCPKCGRLQQPADFCRNQECNTDIHGVKSSLAGLRFHDLRHTSITMLSESQASDSTLLSIAGHVSRKMLEHYSHIRMAAKRIALDAQCATPKVSQIATGGTVTSQNHVTNERSKNLSN